MANAQTSDLDSYSIIFLFVVSSAPPTLVTISKVTATTISVQWGPVDCIHYNGYNGNVVIYILLYEAEQNGDTQTHITIGEYATISNLMPYTTYSIKVAAVNSAGIGEFSHPLMTITVPSELMSVGL